MSLKANVSSVSPSSERLEEFWVVAYKHMQKMELAIGGNMETTKQE